MSAIEKFQEIQRELRHTKEKRDQLKQQLMERDIRYSRFCESYEKLKQQNERLVFALEFFLKDNECPSGSIACGYNDCAYCDIRKLLKEVKGE